MPKIHDASASHIAQFRQCLLKWYDQNQRSLPWRDIAANEEDNNIKAYAVWVSEIMLQQTQVATVVEYFNRWLKHWPQVEDLAAADLDQVLKVWSGLGYYSRAKRLREGAQKVCAEMDGRVPDTAETLLQLPGVGRYTAGAVASIAFGRPAPVVDGNVVRVLARMRAVGASSNSKAVTDWLWTTAGELVDPGRPGDFNQALMELGATVCTPREPSCRACPVRQLCAAHRLTKERNAGSVKSCAGDSAPAADIEDCAAPCSLCLPDGQWEPGRGVLNFPRKPRKAAPRAEQVAACVLHRDRRRFLLCQRPDSGLLASLWEFPSVQLTEAEPSEVSVDDALRRLLPGPLSPAAGALQPLGDITHVFTHIRRVYRARAAEVLETEEPPVPAGYRAVRWVTREELLQAGIPTPVRKILKLFEAEPVPKRAPARPAQKSDGKRQASLTSFFGPVTRRRRAAEPELS